MKVAVIGANSYIARNMLKVNMLKQYADVELFDCGEEHLDNMLNYRQIDLFSSNDVELAIKNCNLIYFFIGKTGTLSGFEYPDLFLDVNEKLLLYLLKAYYNICSTAKIIFPSTRLVYKGDVKLLAEDAPKEFLTPYAIQKYACEQYLKMYNNLFGVKYCILRIGVPYGTLVHPVMYYGTIDFFLEQARLNDELIVYGDGNQRRTFTNIEDLGHILWLAGLNEQCVNNIYNIGGENLSIGEIAEKIACRVGCKINYKSWPLEDKKIESGNTVFNSDKIDRLLNYDYKMNIDKWLNSQPF